MRKVVASTFLTLDGVMQAPGGKGEDPEDSFQHEGWMVPLSSDEVGEFVQGWVEEADALLLGRKTYEIFAGYWPNAPAGDAMGDYLNSVKKYVASRTLSEVGWQNSELVEGDAAEGVARLKQSDGRNIHIFGSGDLIQTLLKHNLLDDIRLFVFPIVLGTGKRLFGGGTVPASLRLTGSQSLPNGVIMMTYERAGEPEYGSFE